MPQLDDSMWKNTTDCDLLARLAAEAALSSNWQEAVKINEKILTFENSNVEALNRLARAQICMGQLEKAKKTYKKSLEIDPYNIIANKNMAKIAKANGQGPDAVARITTFAPNLSSLFLSEPGKTKVVNLLNLAQPSVLAILNYGEKVNMITKTHAVTIATEEGTYLGALPDDLAHKIIAFVAGGNKYEAYVKAVSPKLLTIFIRETLRDPRFINQPSFQTTQISYFENEE